MAKLTKQQKNIGIIFLVVVGLILASNQGLIKLPFAISQDQYIEAPLIGYYECAEARQTTTSQSKSIIGGDAGWVSCPPNSEACDLFVQSQETSILARKVVIQICDYPSFSNCQTQKSYEAETAWFKSKGKPTIQIADDLPDDKRIYVNYQKCIGVFSFGNCVGKWVNTDGASIYSIYKPFILWKTTPLTGRNEYSSLEQACTFSNKEKGSLVDSIFNLKTSLTQTSTEDNKLTPFKTRNFIESFIPLSINNVQFVTYNNKDGYCVNKKVYSIGTITTNEKTLRVVDTNLNNIIVEYPKIDCCPGDTEPNKKCENFKWVSVEKAQCSAFSPCPSQGIWNPSTNPRELLTFNCIDNKCIPQTRKVECVRDSDCINNFKGGVCDKFDYTCSSIAPPVTNIGNNSDSSGILIGDCSDCDAYAKSLLFGWIDSLKLFKQPLSCEAQGASLFPPRLPQSNVICAFSFFKYLLVFVGLIFGTLFSFNLFQNSRQFRIKNRLMGFMASITVGLVIAVATFYLWWLGLIALIIVSVIKGFIK